MIDKKSYMAGFMAVRYLGTFRNGKYRIGDVLTSAQLILETDLITGVSYYRVLK